MQLHRFTKLRAASTTCTQATKCPRGFWVHPPQNGVRSRTYASSPIPEVKNSNVTLTTAGLVMATAGGLYLSISHDLSPFTSNALQANLQPHPTQPGKLVGENDEKMRSQKIKTKDDPSAPGSGRPDPNAEIGPKAMGSGAEGVSPDVADPADPRGKPRSFNYMSGKQEGLSNGDTHHSSQISKQSEMSKKGEGVAETAKLKGTVSTNRPGPENKEERGKAQMEKK